MNKSKKKSLRPSGGHSVSNPKIKNEMSDRNLLIKYYLSNYLGLVIARQKIKVENIVGDHKKTQ